MSTHHVVAAALVDEAGRLLLCHRSPSRRWYPSVWDLPGGHVEPGESEPDALRREIREELGIDVLSLDPEPCARTEAGGNDLPEGVLHLSIWLVRAWSGVPENRAPEEHDQMFWASSSDLNTLPLAYESFREIYQALLRG